MNKKITTLLFDLDGTLIDTNDLIVSSYLHTLGQYYPGKYGKEDVLPFMGPTLHEVFTGIDPEKVEEMIAIYRKYNVEHHDLLVKEFDGVFETIRTLHENGYKMAIVSTKVRNVVLKGLVLTNLDQFFDVVISLDEVERAKPDPEPLEKALAALGSTPEEAMMIGDNHHDILGGKNAGTATCGVAWSLKGREYLEEYQPDYILENMADLLDIVGVGIK
ncbi:pyrophosphatase PpaX [Lederbergia citrea]|uniref:Pyrophosphatase PpaX n=1 Tax=Lederbergia citrea TaxID=2833581 RepID=A0A942UQN6_9BACI|nr:pyrophosphatase PpaX [Lederbergia citrea]MBS4178411.1 pyrophosphatase PpaX [Lederbergia citrea]MBS4205086.1 pyrophosphatase PpaX [Lederbergia citrea]MBS4223058.1 pyrophosphatase PpaX [Lederbergia citrea]